jgi:hypothetical protein
MHMPGECNAKTMGCNLRGGAPVGCSARNDCMFRILMPDSASVCKDPCHGLAEPVAGPHVDFWKTLD